MKKMSIGKCAKYKDKETLAGERPPNERKSAPAVLSVLTHITNITWQHVFIHNYKLIILTKH